MKYDIKIICVLLISCAFNSVQANLEITGPDSLIELLDSEHLIQNQLSNFGHIPYGQTLIGRLFFNSSNPHGCKKGTGFTKDFAADSDDALSSIFLVERGNCTFVTQTRNIQRAGGALAIIIDTKNEDVTEIILSDDGTGAGIEIPAMLINKKQGEILKNFFKSASKDDIKALTLKASFEPNRLDSNDVNAELWYTTSNGQAMDFIKGIEEYIQPIVEHVNIEPKFVTWACPNCDSDFKRKNCFGDGKYCASHHSAKLPMSGVDVLMEDIRQYCIFALAKGDGFDSSIMNLSTIFYSYVTEAHELCRSRITEECSKLALDAVGLPFEPISECVEATFENKQDKVKSENVLLKQQAMEWQNYGHNTYPSLIINSKTFRGRLTPDNAFEAICAAFKNEPSTCRVWQEEMGIEVPQGRSSGINQKTLFVLIIVLIIINIVIILVYRNYLQKEIDSEMKTQVSSAVSQYIALSQVPELNKIDTEASGAKINIQGNAEGDTKSTITLDS